MPTLSYDLHVHPAPSAAPRWGDGARVWQAAADAGVRGFVWKAHEEHTVRRCLELPAAPVRAIGSASLNPWAGIDDVRVAVEEGACWLWGPTLTAGGAIGWNLPLPEAWETFARWLRLVDRPLVLATGHLGGDGRDALAELATENDRLTCSVTHSLSVPLPEALRLVAAGCAFEVDAFTYAFPPSGLDLGDPARHVHALLDAGALVYFTSDGGQASTGNPFVFGATVLDRLADAIGDETAATIGIENPSLLVSRLEPAVAR
jgi:hypothetical protein